ncbi:cell filamentation protein Fic [Nosocomiicoccus sp. HMSC067E10]|uniref:Fic family protein n=1 Tax=Nosocomiicoccus sp. HMSC067E10 TaxID=1739271 RepID=UPI0008A395E5|nr:Fic family protein [Nosocomiicoccus sp. HMSC067E10]OFL46273.1 cell filamentation protein Fic [Nosocomiicoccus sp. HMSC067E10]
MKYKDLKTVFHMSGTQEWENEYTNRFNHYGSYRTDINIHPIQDQRQKLDVSYPVFFSITKTIFESTETILLNSNKINFLLNEQPETAKKAYITKLIINELQSTNEKENIRSTKEDIADAIYSVDVNKKNKKFLGLVKQYTSLQKVNGERFENVKDFRTAYDKLLINEIDPEELPDGELFRTSGVGIYDRSTNKWTHRNEFNEAEINLFLKDIIQFNKYYKAPQLLKIVSTHFMFEYLHPFYDGNGRLGRYILAKELIAYLDIITAFTFSYTINRNRGKYDKSFEKATNFHNKGELTLFIDTMLKLIIEGQESAIKDFEDNKQKLSLLVENLKNENLLDDEFIVIKKLLEDKVFGSHYSRISVKKLVEEVPFSRQKVDKILKKHLDKLDKLKGNPVVYEIKDSFIERLLSY